MKTKFLIFFTLAGLISCSDKISEDQSSMSRNDVLVSLTRTPEEACNLAELFIKTFDSPTRNNVDVSNSEIENIVVIGNTATRVDADTLLYAVNMKDNSGYVIVSAYSGDDGIIGFVENGTYDSHNVNPSYEYYLDVASSYVANEFNRAITPTKPIPDPSTIEIFKTETIGPNVSVEWGQRYPEGIFCPNGISGCTQTAMAQMLLFLKKPNSIKITYPERDVDSQNLNWDEILKHKKSSASKSQHSECVVNDDVHESIGRLCRELGYRNVAIYNPNSTGSNIFNAKATMEDILTSNIISDIKYFNTDYTNLALDLSDGKTVAYVRGNDSSNNEGGHAWVCDGYTLHIIGNNVVMSNEETKFEVKSEIYFYHFNWGWNGQDNGYFKAGVFSIKDENDKEKYNFNDNVMFFTIK